MKLKTLALTICATSCLAACDPVPHTDALFKDVMQRPPDAKPETIKALGNDEPFGRWVVLVDRLCDRWGCNG